MGDAEHGEDKQKQSSQMASTWEKVCEQEGEPNYKPVLNAGFWFLLLCITIILIDMINKQTPLGRVVIQQKMIWRPRPCLSVSSGTPGGFQKPTVW